MLIPSKNYINFCFFIFETGPYHVALAWSEVHYVDQASFKFTEIHLSLLPSAGITRMGYYIQQKLVLIL